MRDRNEQQGLHILHITCIRSCMLLSIQCSGHLRKANEPEHLEHYQLFAYAHNFWNPISCSLCGAAAASKCINAFLRTATLQWYVQRRAQRSEYGLQHSIVCNILSMACPAKSVLNMFLLARTQKTQLIPKQDSKRGD